MADQARAQFSFRIGAVLSQAEIEQWCTEHGASTTVMTTVRNPWLRTVSAYIDKVHPPTRLNPTLVDPLFNKVRHFWWLPKDAIPSFSQFVQYLAVTPDSSGLDVHVVSEAYKCGVDQPGMYTNILKLEEFDATLPSLLRRLHWPTSLAAVATEETMSTIDQIRALGPTAPEYANLAKQVGDEVIKAANSTEDLARVLYASDPHLNLTHLIAERYADDICVSGESCYTPP